MDSRLKEILVESTRRSFPLQIAKYLQEVVRMAPADRDLFELARRFPAWRHSNGPGRGPLVDQKPWITLAAIDFLESILQRQFRVFEYGAGGSSLFFADRVASGASVEHDEAWAAATRRALESRGADWEIIQMEPEPAPAGGDPAALDGYFSSDPDFRTRSFRAYAQTIERFAGDFDLVFIDGRARPSCFLHGVAKVKAGGWLVLDNADRPNYHGIHERLDQLGWTKRRFAGPSAYGFPFDVTCAWQRPAAG